MARRIGSALEVLVEGVAGDFGAVQAKLREFAGVHPVQAFKLGRGAMSRADVTDKTCQKIEFHFVFPSFWLDSVSAAVPVRPST